MVVDSNVPAYKPNYPPATIPHHETAKRTKPINPLLRCDLLTRPRVVWESPLTCTCQKNKTQPSNILLAATQIGDSRFTDSDICDPRSYFKMPLMRKAPRALFDRVPAVKLPPNGARRLRQTAGGHWRVIHKPNAAINTHY